MLFALMLFGTKSLITVPVYTAFKSRTKANITTKRRQFRIRI